jgi:energy-coupling factor transporter ATP-binding protein EcfA2
LRPYVKLCDSDVRLLIAWTAAALRPNGPYPILAIYGEQGSAKSTLAKIVSRLIDPQSSSLLAEPKSARDLMVTAVNGWLLSFDNILAIPDGLSDSLCRLSTGGVEGVRRRGSDPVEEARSGVRFTRSSRAVKLNE